MKNTTSRFRLALKICAAAVCAFVVLNLFCMWYFNPTGYEHDDYRATDVVRYPDTFTSRAKEGMAWSVTDANGYNNDANLANAAQADGIAVLIMGSSHVEAFNVGQKQSASYILDAACCEKLGGRVYNIGMSAHHFARNAANLERALAHFAPTKYVVVEAISLSPSSSQIARALDDSFKRVSATDVPVPRVIYDQPFFKSTYRQLIALEKQAPNNDNEEQEEAAEQSVGQDAGVDAGYLAELSPLIQKMSEAAHAHGVELIIAHHSHVLVGADSTCSSETTPLQRATFAQACSNAGVTFVDTDALFAQEYEATRSLPYGFANTVPGAGHLNSLGHRMLAESLARAIDVLEAGGSPAEASAAGSGAPDANLGSGEEADQQAGAV